MALRALTATTTVTTAETAAALTSTPTRCTQAIIQPLSGNSGRIFIVLPNPSGTDILAYELAQPTGTATDFLDSLPLPGPGTPVEGFIDLSLVKFYVENSGDGVNVAYFARD